MSIGEELPTELASLVVNLCDSRALLALCLTSKAWQFLAQRSLFRKIDIRTLAHCVACCRTLSNRPDLCAAVREFLAMFESNDCIFSAFWTLLAGTLSSMRNLAALHFAMPGPSNIIFRECNFPQLRALSSVLDLSPELNAFLARHPSITQLCIGGETPEERLILPASALPALETYLGSRALARDIIPGRPVAKMTLAWTTRMSDIGITDAIQSLAQGSVPMRHFGCTTFGGDANDGIVLALAAHMPDLHTLRISNVSSGRSSDITSFALAIVVALRSFKELRRLDMPCIANANDESYDYTQETAEESVVKCWGTACPSLEVVIMPSCMVWHFKREQNLWRRETDEGSVTGFETFF